MRVRGLNCHLVGTEGSSPPLPYIEVTASQGAALIGRGDAVEVDGADAPEPETDEGEADNGERATLIADALHLVEPDGLEAKGDRKGKPTIAAIAAITDLSDVTEEEIDAALAAHEAANA